MPVFKDCVLEETGVIGTGDAVLSGAVTGFTTFAAAGVANGSQIDYSIRHQAANEWEAGRGTYQSGAILRQTVTQSSAGPGNHVNFSSGVKYAALTISEIFMEDITASPDAGNVVEFRNNGFYAPAGATGPPGPEGPPGASFTTFEYMYDLSHSEPPTTNEVRVDNSLPASTTKVWIHDISATGMDNANAFSIVAIGSVIFIQDKDDSTKWASFTVTATPIDKGVYYEFPVVWKDNGLSLTAQRVLINISVTGYTNEMAQDAVGNILIDSETVQFLYNDAAPYIKAYVRYSDSITENPLGGIHLINDVTSPSARNFYGTDNTGARGWYDFYETAQDAIGLILIDSLSIQLNYSDATPSISASIRNYDSIVTGVNGIHLINDTSAPGISKLYGTDATGVKGWFNQPTGGGGFITSVTDTTTIDLTVTGTDLSANVKVGSLSNQYLGTMPSQSIKARNTAGNGPPEDISVTQVLNWITSTTNSMLVRGSSQWEALAPGANGSILMSAGGQPIWAQIQINQNQIRGRIAAGVGDVGNLTSAQATTIIDTFTSSLKGLAPASGGGTANFLRADGTWVVPAGGGGTTILDGAGPPTNATGAVGDYYEETTNGVMYGPKSASGYGSDQRITVANVSNNTYSNEAGVRVRFNRAGRITRVRYHRIISSLGLDATQTVRVWNEAGSKVTEVSDTQTAVATGYFTVTLPVTVNVAANSVYTFSISGATNSPRRANIELVTSTTDCAFLAFYYNLTRGNFPNTIQSGMAFYVEPIFEPDDAWPVTVREIPFFSAAADGMVPLSGGGTTNFLCADGTWTTPPVIGIGTDTATIDLTLSAGLITGAVIDNSISNVKAADMATARLKGRVTAATGDPEDLTGTQATTLLDVFTSTLKGLAPLSGGGTANFLRADGTWNVPPGSGGGFITSITDTASIDLTVTGTALSADLKNSSVDNAHLVNGAVTNAKLANMGALTLKGNNTGASAQATDLVATDFTAMINLFTSVLKGLVPASGGGTTNFLRADGTFAIPPGTGGASAPDIQIFTANGTWNKPAGKTMVRLIVIGGGGGGGSGRRGAASTGRFGGGGGKGGSYAEVEMPITACNPTETVGVGSFGVGGAAQLAANTAGNPGTDGGVSFFGTNGNSNYTAVYGGRAGAGGTASTGVGGSSVTDFSMWIGGDGGDCVGATAHDGRPLIGEIGKAGGGGGCGSTANASNVVVEAGNGGVAGIYRFGGAAGLYSGAGNPPVNGSVGLPSSATSYAGGSGGGGGSYGANANSGDGGNGGYYGGGGGGGGGGTNTFTGGKGGDGAPGIVVVIST